MYSMNSSKFNLGLALASLAILVLMIASPGLAGTIIVTNTNDSGAGSLRDAIASASSGDTINFNLTYPATITLTTGSLQIPVDLTISGPGESNLAISGNNASKIFEIPSGVTIVITGLAMQDGYFGGLCCEDVYSAGGGAIENLGTLTLTGISISQSSGARGGGINNWGTLTVNDSLIANNTSCCGLAAGGIWNAGTMTVHKSTFVGNEGYYDGGGIFSGGPTSVDGSTFLNNHADHGAGGGIYGGGAPSTPVTVTNSTFLGNTAASNGGGVSDGGGAYGGGGTLLIANSTFSGNGAGGGGDIANFSNLTLKSTILANSSLTGGDCYAGGGTTTSTGYNISDDGSCSGFMTAIGDVNNTPAGFDPSGLQSNGGPTQTIALLSTSPAVDSIPTSACTDVNGNPVTKDQRGISRPQGSACDAGAYELIPAANDGVPTGAVCVAPPGNMVAWWPGDGNANDIISGNNGTLENGATFASGAVAQAFALDGVNQYVDAGNRPSLQVSSGDFTVDAWVKFDTLGGLAATCSGGGGTNCDMSIADKMLDATGVNTNGWRLIKQADNHFWFCLGGGSFNGCTPGGPLTVRSNTFVTTGQWYFVAGVKAGNMLSIYVNGSQESSITLGSSFLDTNSTDLLIGAHAGEGAYLDGEVDEVELFNRALAPLEIQALYDAGSAGKCKPVNQAPVANAGTNQTVECAGPSGTKVTLNGSASSDHDGDALTYKWTDPSNAIVGTSATVTVTAPMGTTTYTLTVTDAGGLSSTASTQVTVQDTTPPTLTLSQTNLTVVVPTASATGVNSSTLNLNSFASATDICDPSPTITNNAPALLSIGTTIVTFTATDHSGNSSTKSFSIQVVYNFIGYFAPILNDGSAIYNSGRTIPVKFELTAADGTIVTNAVANLFVAMTSNLTIGTTDMTDATASGGSDTGNLFRFDPTSGQYIYNLSTGGFASGTWLIRAIINDGTVHNVLFSIR